MGLSLRGAAFITVLAGLKVLLFLESDLPCCCSSYKIQDQEATITVLVVSAIFAGCAREGYRAATFLKLNPFVPWKRADYIFGPRRAPGRELSEFC